MEGEYDLDPVKQLVTDAVFRMSCSMYESEFSHRATVQQQSLHTSHASTVERFRKQKDIL